MVLVSLSLLLGISLASSRHFSENFARICFQLCLSQDCWEESSQYNIWLQQTKHYNREYGTSRVLQCIHEPYLTCTSSLPCYQDKQATRSMPHLLNNRNNLKEFVEIS